MSDLIAHPGPLLAFGLVIALVLLLARVLLGSDIPPYEQQGPLLGEVPLQFYRVLREAIQDDWSLLRAVPLGEVFKVRHGVSKPHLWQKKLGSHKIDFLLCDADTMRARLAIALDPPTEDEQEEGERDVFLDEACGSADLCLLRVTIRPSYNKDSLRASIKKAIA